MGGPQAKPNNNDVSPLELLAQIRDLMSQQVSSGMAEDYVAIREEPIGTAASALLIVPDGQIGYVYIPDAPRDVAIYGGRGHARYLGKWAQGEKIEIQVSRCPELEIEYSAGSAATLTVWISSRPIKISGAGVPRGVATYAPVSRVSVTNTSTPVVSVDPLRKVALIYNYGAENLFLDTNGGTADTSTGYVLTPGSEYRHESTTAVTGIIASAGPVPVSVSDQR